jgi:hypothetical protein
MKLSTAVAAFALATLLPVMPALTQSEGDPNCRSDGYCPVYGGSGEILYYTRPSGYFSTDEGRSYLGSAPAPDEDSSVVNPTNAGPTFRTKGAEPCNVSFIRPNTSLLQNAKLGFSHIPQRRQRASVTVAEGAELYILHLAQGEPNENVVLNPCNK